MTHTGSLLRLGGGRAIEAPSSSWPQVNDPTLVVPEVDVGGDTERPTPRTGCALADELRASLRARASELPSQADLLLAAASPVDDIRRHAAVCMLQERRALLAVEAAVANPRARL